MRFPLKQKGLTGRRQTLTLFLSELQSLVPRFLQLLETIEGFVFSDVLQRPALFKVSP